MRYHHDKCVIITTDIYSMLHEYSFIRIPLETRRRQHESNMSSGEDLFGGINHEFIRTENILNMRHSSSHTLHRLRALVPPLPRSSQAAPHLSLFLAGNGAMDWGLWRTVHGRFGREREKRGKGVKKGAKQEARVSGGLSGRIAGTIAGEWEGGQVLMFAMFEEYRVAECMDA